MCWAQARCPPVTVRAAIRRSDDSRGGPSVVDQGVVVVGVQEPGPGTDALLDFAFGEASRTAEPRPLNLNP
jgi:hypothetical protein